MDAIAMAGLLDCEYFDIASDYVGDEFRIFVAKPPFLAAAKCPAVYVADGNTLFAQTMSIQRTLAWGAEVPAAYVIGIGYPTEAGFLPAIAKRNRDYAPTAGGAYARDVLRSTYEPGGVAFLSFIDRELKPQLASRYGIEDSDSTFVAASLGSLFGAWALLNSPQSFQKYVLSSPALWWNDEEVWRWEQAAFERSNDLKATVFVSAGGLEMPHELRQHAEMIVSKNPMLKPQVEATMRWHDQHGWPQTAELTQRFANKLNQRGYLSLKACCHNMPEETHMSVTPAVISRGLRYVFGSWEPAARS